MPRLVDHDLWLQPLFYWTSLFKCVASSYMSIGFLLSFVIIIENIICHIAIKLVIKNVYFNLLLISFWFHVFRGRYCSLCTFGVWWNSFPHNCYQPRRSLSVQSSSILLFCECYLNSFFIVSIKINVDQNRLIFDDKDNDGDIFNFFIFQDHQERRIYDIHEWQWGELYQGSRCQNKTKWWVRNTYSGFK